MKLSPIISEIRKRCPVFEERIYGASRFAVIDQSTVLEMPCAFVVPLGETAETAITDTAYQQNVNQDFGVIVYVSTADDEQGKVAFDTAEDIKAQLLHALAGWCPTDDTDEIVYAGNTILDLNRARLAIQYEWSVPYALNNTDTRQGTDFDAMDEFLRVGVDVDQCVPDSQIDARLLINVRGNKDGD